MNSICFLNVRLNILLGHLKYIGKFVVTVMCVFVCLLVTLSTSSLKPLNQLKANFAGMLIMWSDKHNCDTC